MRLKKSLFLLLIAAVLFSLVSAGCGRKTRKEREEERRLEKEDAAVNERIRTLRAVEGTYEGEYRASGAQVIAVDARFFVTNLPGPGERGTGYLDRVSYHVEVVETAAENRLVGCNANDVKPDLGRGIIRVVCDAGGPRTYVFGFDEAGKDFESTPLEAANLAERSRMTLDHVLQNRVRTVSALNLQILGPYADFAGRMRRTSR